MSASTRQRLANRMGLAYPTLDPMSQGVPRSPDPTEFVDLVDTVLDELVERLLAALPLAVSVTVTQPRDLLR